MKPVSLSATALDKYEDCPASFKAQYCSGGRVEDLNNSAALLGSTCHLALERWVPMLALTNNDAGFEALRLHYEEAYNSYFKRYRERFDEGVEILRNWHSRSGPEYWEARTVLKTEDKRSFEVPSSEGPIKFNFICDREDRVHSDGSLEIIDYKSKVWDCTADQMRDMIQPRLYATAAMIEAPQMDFVWVTYDFLRFGQVSIRLTKEECRSTWRYLKEVAQRIIDDDGEKETLNENCNYCVRKGECKVLKHHIAAGGQLKASGNPLQATDQYLEVSAAIRALNSYKDELASAVLLHCRAKDIREFKTAAGVEAYVEPYRRRSVDFDAARKIAPEVMHGVRTLKAFDKAMKDPSLADEQRSALRSLIHEELGELQIKARKKEARGGR